MKTHILRTFLFFFLVVCMIPAVKAQYVAIPDTNFGIWLNQHFYYYGCTTGSSQAGWFLDTTCIQPPVYQGVTLSITNAGISDLTGLEYLRGYSDINLSGNKLKKVPWQYLDNGYGTINLDNNLIDTLDLTILDAVSQGSYNGLIFSINRNKIKATIPNSGFINMPNVRELDMNYNLLDTLPVLQGKVSYGLDDFYLRARHNNLHGEFDGKYGSIDVGANHITSLKFTIRGGDLFCDSNQITVLSESYPSGMYDAVGMLKCQYNNLTTLPSSTFKWSWVDCSHNQITSLPINYVTLNCSYNNLSAIPSFVTGPCSWCSSQYLDCSHNPALTCLPQLPSNTIFYLDASFTAVSCVPNRYSYCNYTGPTPASGYPLCGTLATVVCPGYATMEGLLYQDSVVNCAVDSQEVKVKHYPVNLYKNGLLAQRAISFDNGYYGMSMDTGSYYVKADTAFIDVLNVHCPATDTFTAHLSNTSTQLTGLDFGFECAPGFDLTAWSMGTANRIRSGSTNRVSVNAGDLAKEYGVSCMHGIGGQVRVIKHSSIAHYGSTTSVIPPVVSGDTLTWTVADFGTVNNDGDFSFSLSVDSTAPSGTPVCMALYVTPTAGDNDSTNNQLYWCFVVDNSHDPNYKTVFPEGTINNVPTWLTYTVHFQNTGNDTAFNVHVNDTIDTRYVDISTLQYVGSSSPCYIITSDNGAMRLDFPHINLLDSAYHESQSTGWVQYKIQTKPNLIQNPIIKNTASIYFDFNSAVNTNATYTYVCTEVDTFAMHRFFCTGDSFHFGYRDLTVPGLYVDTFLSVGGCDSITRLYLTTRPVRSSTLHQEICAGYGWYFNGQYRTSTGVYIDTVTGPNGCDSILTLDLHVRPKHYADTVYASACPASYPYIYQGLPYYYAADYDIYVSSDSFGCGVYRLFRLTDEIHADTIHQSFCDSFYFSGNYYYYPGEFYDVIPGGSYTGCDSTIVLSADWFHTPVSRSATICYGDYYVFYGQILFQPGIYTASSTYGWGCDTVVTLTLIADTPAAPVISAVGSTLMATAHGALAFQWYLNGQQISGATAATYIASQSGDYTIEETNGNGCIAISYPYAYNITNCQGSILYINATICKDSSYIFDGATLTAAGTYRDTIQLPGGCDSIILLHLSVDTASLPQVSIAGNILTAVAPGAVSYQWYLNAQPIFGATGASYSALASGSYIIVQTDSQGCSAASAPYIYTSIACHSNTFTLAAQICAGDSYDFNGTQIFAPGVYRDSVSLSSGCDSIIILSLTVDTPLTPVIAASGNVLTGSVSGAASYQWYFNSQPIAGATTPGYSAMQDGVYVVVQTDTAGCVARSLPYTYTVCPHVGIATASICAGDSISFGGLVLHGSGTYIDTIRQASYCDSVSILRLIVDTSVVPAIYMSGDTLYANPVAGISYQWYRNTNIIYGATAGYFVLHTSGSYSVTRTDVLGCRSAQSSAFIVSGINTVSADEVALSLYPNPGAGIFMVESNGLIGCGAGIYNAIGQLVWQEKIVSGSQQFNLTTLADGIYTMIVDHHMARFCIVR